MIKSVSLKEFSTTPTVSYMLSKNGQNLAIAIPDTRGPPANPSPAPREMKINLQKPTDEEDEMYEME